MTEKIKQVKPEDLVGPLKSSSIIQRHPLNPIFTSENVPYPSVIAYNAGVVKYQGQYVMVFRNDYNWNNEEQKAIGFQIGVAYSEDGIGNWRVHPKPILEFEGGEDVRGSFDPRVTILDGRIYITYCQFTGHGYVGTLAVTDDFEHIEIVSRVVPDNRDIVLFPERINDLYSASKGPFPSTAAVRGCTISGSASRPTWSTGENLSCCCVWRMFPMPTNAWGQERRLSGRNMAGSRSSTPWTSIPIAARMAGRTNGPSAIPQV